VVPGVGHNGQVYYRTLGDKAFDIHRKAFEKLNDGK
jgi:hypothetical protein